MLAQVKKLIEPAVGGDFAGRLGAWWNGQDYVPPPPVDPTVEEGQDAAPPADAPPAAAPAVAVAAAPPSRDVEPASGPAPDPSVGPGDLRLKALAALWGTERLGPGSLELDARLLDAVFDTANSRGDIGFIGADASLLNAAHARSNRKLHAAEWRADCVERLRALAPAADIQASETDRPRWMSSGNLEGLVSIEAFAYADHKAGLASRAFRALSPTGRWVILDTVRHTAKTPAECFASAWAEPQLAAGQEIEDLLRLAGFANVTHVSMTEAVTSAARSGFKQVGELLEGVVKMGLAGRNGAIFLQELTWEIQTWRARLRAFEGGALSVDLWIADKDPERAASAPAAASGTVERAADALFEAAAPEGE